MTLKDLLLIQSITKNLMSFSKFAKENLVFFEFHGNPCCVKSHATKEVLLEGTIREDGLYYFKNFHPYQSTSQDHTIQHHPY